MTGNISQQHLMGGGGEDASLGILFCFRLTGASKVGVGVSNIMLDHYHIKDQIGNCQTPRASATRTKTKIYKKEVNYRLGKGSKIVQLGPNLS